MKNNKKLIMGVIAFLAIGFAAVSTTLYLTGTLNIGANLDDYDVYFSNAKVNGVEDKSVIVDDTHITFEASLKDIGEEYELEYFITNGSRNYDSAVSMNCTSTENEYLSITNTWVNPTTIEATNTLSGVLKATMTKGYVEEEETEIEVTCNITADAVSRTTLGDGTPMSKVVRIPVTAVNSDNVNLNATSYEITGTVKDELLNKLVETNLIDDVSDVTALIEVQSDSFDNLATTTFDVSSIAEDGDKVVILHFNEETEEWEFIAEETVTNGQVIADFSSFSPVAFVVKKPDGTYENVTHAKAYTLVNDVNNNGVADIGDEICLGSECFYVISNDNDEINALAKYNLYVSGDQVGGELILYDSPSGIQESTMLGNKTGVITRGVTKFGDSSNYIGSTVENYVNQYALYLESTGVTLVKNNRNNNAGARLLSVLEVQTLLTDGEEMRDFSYVKGGAEDKGVLWLFNTSYWLSTSADDEHVFSITADGLFFSVFYLTPDTNGVRPVITIAA